MNEQNVFLWIETKNDSLIRWFSLSLETKIIQEIPTSQSTAKPLNWITSIGCIGIFSKLKSSKNPGIECIEAYDLRTGNLIYHIACQYWYETRGENIRIKIDNQTYWMNMTNGQFVEEYTISNPSIVHINEVENPNHYEENQNYFKEFQEFFIKKFNERISKGIDYWEGKEKLIFSYYIYDQGWKNYLKICDSNFAIEYQELISEGDLMGYNTFQIIKNQVIYVINKQQIVVYEY